MYSGFQMYRDVVVMGGERKQGPQVQKAMGYVARSIMRVKEDMTTKPNEGLR